jgi:hypothetical protein
MNREEDTTMLRYHAALLAVLLAGPVRADVATIAAAIDREIDARLAKEKVPASPPADDAEFLRRVYLDITGRIPTPERAAAFLDSTDPDKRKKLIDELLADAGFGRHLADLWRPLLAPRDPANTKPQPDRFSPWLAEQLNRGRGWDTIAADLVGFRGDVKDAPQSAFLMAHGENFQPLPGNLAAAVGKVFLGVQIQCAECHDHPFAPWRQADFWGLAAFFGQVRNSGVKGPPFILTEDPDLKPLPVKNGGIARPEMRPGGAIVIPATGGNSGAGKVIAARLPGGKPLELPEGPYRPRFIEWLTARDNTYFARAFVNRTWARLFGLGLVEPVDNLHDDNPAAYPEVLKVLADEFATSGYDVKHLVRCICNSRAYQRSSRPVAGNEKVTDLFARMSVKPVGPEALYDSLAVVFSATKTGMKPGGKPAGPGEIPNLPRDQFVAFFRGPGGGESGDFAHGIPQFLRRLNGEPFNQGGPLIERLANVEVGPAIEMLFLATLSRRPTPAEAELMAKYVAGRPARTQGYEGVLWILLNSGEFVLTR